jgi:murein DD-endopeptidase MepM/ murein hydrolase activator NlpD
VGAPDLASGEDDDDGAEASSPERPERDDGARIDLATRVPARWLSDEADELPIQSPRLLRTLPRECRTRGGYREHCQGPRRVPEPHGREAELAQRLALGQRATVLVLRMGRALDEWLDAAGGTDARAELDFPVPGGRVGRGFGRVRQGEIRHRRHFGIDIGADEGTPIVAARGGLVVFSDDALTGFGNAVMILHEDDSTTFYAHCRKTIVFAGQRVARGAQIAEVGATGFAEAPHLHFEYRIRGWARDPRPLFGR